MAKRELSDILREQSLRAIYPNFTTLANYDEKVRYAELKLDDQRGRATGHPMDWLYDNFSLKDPS